MVLFPSQIATNQLAATPFVAVTERLRIASKAPPMIANTLFTGISSVKSGGAITGKTNL